MLDEWNVCCNNYRSIRIGSKKSINNIFLVWIQSLLRSFFCSWSLNGDVTHSLSFSITLFDCNVSKEREREREEERKKRKLSWYKPGHKSPFNSKIEWKERKRSLMKCLQLKISQWFHYLFLSFLSLLLLLLSLSLSMISLQKKDWMRWREGEKFFQSPSDHLTGSKEEETHFILKVRKREKVREESERKRERIWTQTGESIQ